MNAVPAHHFEARKWQYRQTKEGVVVSFLIHPLEVSPALAIAELGTRFMVALAEINDDETPKHGPETAPETHAARLIPERPPHTDSPHEPKPRRKFDTLPLSQQCALRCGEAMFQRFLRENGQGEILTANAAAERVRHVCSISSRAELDAVQGAADLWKRLDAKFQEWLTTQAHAETYR